MTDELQTGLFLGIPRCLSDEKKKKSSKENARKPLKKPTKKEYSYGLLVV